LIAIDSSAIIEILLSGADHEIYAQALTYHDEKFISVATVLESVQVAVGKVGNGGRDCVELLIAESEITIVGLDVQQLGHAIEAFMRFGRGRNHPARLNFGDCMAYALAKSLDAPLLYKGDDFAQTDIRSALE
jgi:ribonuclease VapC